MKKIMMKLTAILAVCIFVPAVLAGCGDSGTPEGSDTSGSETDTAAPPADDPADDPVAESRTFTFDYEGAFGPETAGFVLKPDGVAEYSLPGNEMMTDIYAGTYTEDGDTVTITGLANVDPSSEYKIPGLWEWIDATTGNTVIKIDAAAGTFTPAE